MLYAAMTFWLIVIFFSAWGIHALWSRLLEPRVVNSVLLPGTLVAQLGHVLGLLITGNEVKNTSLMGDDDSGNPRSEAPEQARIPVIEPVLIALLPLVACGVSLWFAARTWGGPLLGNLQERVQLSTSLPTSLGGCWDMLRNAVTLAEAMLLAIVNSNWLQWQTALFLYLAICLTVRMAPLNGNRRGAIGAILLAGLLVAIGSSVIGTPEKLVANSWPILTFAVAMLLLMLIATLIVVGLIRLGRLLMKGA